MRLQTLIIFCLYCSIALVGCQQGGGRGGGGGGGQNGVARDNSTNGDNSTNNRVSDVARQSVYQRLGEATPPWANAGDCDTRNPDFYRCAAWVGIRDNGRTNPVLRSAPPLTPPRAFSAISINVENASVSGRTAEVKLNVQAKCEFLSPAQVFGSVLECTPEQALATTVVVKLQAQGVLGNNWSVTSISEDPQIVSQRQAQHQASQNTAARQQQEGQRFVQLAQAVCRDNDVAAARQALEQGVGNINTSLTVLKAVMPDPCPYAYENFVQVAVSQKNVEMLALLAQYGASLETFISTREGGRNTLLADEVWVVMDYGGNYQDEVARRAGREPDGTIDPDLRRIILALLQNGANPAPGLQELSRLGWCDHPDSQGSRCRTLQTLLRTPVAAHKGSVAPADH